MFGERLKTHHSAMADAKSYVMGPRNICTYLNIQKNNYEQMNQATVYIHIPFCSKICSFCNMRRALQKPRDNYHLLIIEEIKSYAKLDWVKALKFDAIYFGGGTPTTLETNALRAILKNLRKYLNLTNKVEITIETTVSELADDKLEMFKELGVNRFSIGVQTFNDKGRRILGRVGGGEFVYQRLKHIKSMGFQTVSVDLIYNYPNQTKEDLMQDLDKITNLNLDGFSMYSLIGMKETSIKVDGDTDKDKELFDLIAETMETRGYYFLELTKMVKTDEYRYIINRHKGSDTLPIGAGAGGNIAGLMIMNPIDYKEYEDSVDKFDKRQGMLFSYEYKKDVIFKGDIQRGYLPIDILEYNNEQEYKDLLIYMLENNYVKYENDKYKLTRKGIFWGNSISRYLYQMRKK